MNQIALNRFGIDEIISLYKDKPVIKVLQGIRRSGKSFMLKLLSQRIMENGATENQEKQVSLKLYSGLKNITMIFEDNCAPFNPLQQERPVAQGKPDERQAGGLGIFIVLKLMDKVEYKYSGGKNIITMTCEK